MKEQHPLNSSEIIKENITLAHGQAIPAMAQYVLRSMISAHSGPAKFVHEEARLTYTPELPEDTPDHFHMSDTLATRGWGVSALTLRTVVNNEAWQIQARALTGSGKRASGPDFTASPLFLLRQLNDSESFTLAMRVAHPREQDYIPQDLRYAVVEELFHSMGVSPSDMDDEFVPSMLSAYDPTSPVDLLAYDAMIQQSQAPKVAFEVLAHASALFRQIS